MAVGGAEGRTPSGHTDRKMWMASPSSQAFATWNAYMAGSSNQRMGPSSGAPFGRTPNLAALPLSKQYSGLPAARFCRPCHRNAVHQQGCTGTMQDGEQYRWTPLFQGDQAHADDSAST